MSRARGDKRAPLKVATGIFAVIFLLSAVLLIIDVWEDKNGAFDPPVTSGLKDVVEYNGRQYKLKDGVRTFLLIGLDKFEQIEVIDGYTNDYAADFVMLMVIDDNEKKVSAIHINRDCMVDISVLGIAGEQIGIVNRQLALSYSYGNGREVSCINTAEAVSRLFYGIKIDHYVSVTMEAVPTYNDLVGGVEVTVLDDFSGIDGSLKQGETVTLTGDQALTYIRSRRGLEDSTNMARMERQRQYLDALYEKTVECKNSDSSFVMKSASAMANYLVSDCGISQLSSIAKTMLDYEFTEIRTIEGDCVVGKYMEFFPNLDSVKKTVIDLFYIPKN